jgi:hypothetical protein
MLGDKVDGSSAKYGTASGRGAMFRNFAMLAAKFKVALFLVKSVLRHTRLIIGTYRNGEHGFFIPSFSRYDTGWGVFPVVGTKLVPLSRMKARLFWGDLVDLDETPHYQFVKARLRADEVGSEWEEYIRAQHCCGDAEMQRRRENFEELINLAVENRARFKVLVERHEGVFRIVDGFHRAAVLANTHPKKRVLCAVLVSGLGSTEAER